MQSPTLLQQFVRQEMRLRSKGSESSPSDDKRRWLSFLTWAFVLAEMVGRDAFLPGSAQAGEAETGHGDHHPPGTAPIGNTLPNIDDVSSAAESPAPIAYQQAAPMPAYTSDATASELSSAKMIPAADVGGEMHASSLGGGGADLLSGSSDATGSLLHGETPSILDQPIVAGIGHDGSLIDLGLHLDPGDAAQNLIASVADTLGDLPLLDDTLDGLGSALARTTDSLLSTLEPVVSLVIPGNDNSGQFSGDLGLPGQLVFSPAGNGSGPDELAYPQGSYTSYGITLSIGDATDGSAADATYTQADTTAATAIDIHFADDLPGAGSHVGSDALHLDQTILRTAADVLT